MIRGIQSARAGTGHQTLVLMDAIGKDLMGPRVDSRSYILTHGCRAVN